MEKIVNEIMHYGFISKELAECVREEIDEMTDAEQLELLNSLSSNSITFGYQLFSRYLTNDEINRLNAIINKFNGDVEMACYTYPYAYMQVDLDSKRLVFYDDTIPDESFQSIVNMMHVLNAKLKYDPAYRASKGLPPIKEEPLTAESIAKQVEARKNDPYKGLDGQWRYIRGMEDEIKKSKSANHLNTEELGNDGDLNCFPPVEETVQVKETKCTGSIVEGFDLDYDSLVEGGIPSLNPKPAAQVQPTMIPSNNEPWLQLLNDQTFNLCMAYSQFLGNRAQMGDTMAQQELQYFNPMKPFEPYMAQMQAASAAGMTPAQPAQVDSVAMDTTGMVQPGTTHSELSVNPSALIMTDEEEKKQGFVFDNKNHGTIPPLEVSLKMAEQVAHPNAPHPVAQAQPSLGTPMSFSNGFTGGNSGLGMPMMPPTMPAMGGAPGMVSFPPGATIPGPSMFSPQQQAQANSVKSQIAALGLKVTKLGKTGTPVEPTPPQAINIDSVCSKHEADGSMEFRLSSLGNVMRGGVPVDAGLDQSEPEDPMSPEGRANIKAYRDQVAAEMKRRCTPGAYTPQNMTLYNAAHPEGLHESEPGFAEEKAKMAKEMGLEPMTGESISELKTSGFKQVAEGLAGNGASTYKTPLQIAREKALGAMPVSSNPYMMGGVTAAAPVPTGTSKFGHIPENLDNLVYPQFYYPGMGKEWMKPTIEEIEAGTSGLVAIVRNGVNPLEKEFKEFGELRKKRHEKAKTRFYDPKRDGTGVSIVRRPAGQSDEEYDEETGAALDYKEASVLNEMKKADELEYKLANALAVYNQGMADNLLWFRKNKPLAEYMEVRREAVNQLTKYRNNDPAAPAKNVFMAVNDQVMIQKPVHEYSMEEMEGLAKQLEKKAEESSAAGKEKKIIQSYQRQADIINDEAAKSIGADENENSVMNIMRRLQALRNIQVVSYGDDPAHQLINSKVDALPPVQVDVHKQYMIWKKLKRSCWQGNPDEFDKAFDDWWYGPRTTTKKDRLNKWRDYKAHMSGLIGEHLARCEAMQPTKEQIIYQVRSETMKNWREFDQGYIRDDMTTAEFLDSWSFLHSRCMELHMEEQLRSMKNLYDPKGYMDLVTKSAMQDAALRGEAYQFTDSKEYNDKRQRYIDAIFHSAPRGMIS